MLGTQPFIAMDIYKEDGCHTEKRDPCASPPCKRLKQAPISFETMNSTTKEINIKPNSLLLNQEPSTNPLSSTNHLVQQSGQSNSSENNCKINPPLPVSFIILDSQEPAENEPKRKSASNLPESPKHKSRNNSSPIAVKNNSILKFTQPVTPGRPTNVNVSKTPSKDCENSPGTALSTPLKQVISPTTPMLSDQFTSPSLPPTPVNTPKMNTPKHRTPARKLSVEERLKREEEKLKKQKEKEKLEQERLEKKNEKDRIKVEKEKERQEAKQKKEQERLEQVAQKKQQENERQEKKEKEEKEKMERLEKKEEERKKREEEKKKKEDEKNSKNEEKHRKEEEQTMKKQKVQNSFANFFIKKELSAIPKQKEQVKNETKFQPFEIKPGMKLANTKCRQPLSEEAKDSVNKILSEQVTTSLSQVKEEMQKLKTELTHERKIQEELTKKSSKIDDIMLIEHDVSDGTLTINNEKQHTCIKAKLLQFHDNYRPAYFGSWRKQSSSVGPRAPFRKDMNLINYEVDSDEEWEEEEPGESLSNSEGEDEDNEGNNTEVNDGENDGFFVPHGYLSDDEGVENVEDNETQDIDATDSAKLPQHKVEDRMERQLAKQKVWETEMKRQFKPMKPVAIGCMWSGEIPSILKQLEGCSLVESQSIDPCMSSKNYNHVPSNPVSNMHWATAMPVPEEAMPTLITLVHGNTTGLHKLIQMFRKKWTLQTKKDETVLESNWEDHCQISKRQLERKITTIAKKERRSTMPKARWYVHNSVLAQYKMENISLPRNGYISCHIEQMSLVSKVSPSEPSIKQFTQNHPSSMHNEINLHVKSGDLEENLMSTSPV